MTNFKQFNPTKNNMLGDAFYEVSAFLQQGARVRGVLSSSAFNKLMYQVTTMTTALAEMMEEKDDSYEMQDGSLVDLKGSLSNIMTRRDMGIYALGTDLARYISKSAVVIISSTSAYNIPVEYCYRTIQLTDVSSTVLWSLPVNADNTMWVKLKNACTNENGKIRITNEVDRSIVVLSPNEEIVVYYDGSRWRGKKIPDMESIALPTLTAANEKLFINNTNSGVEWAKGFSLKYVSRTSSGTETYTGVGFKPNALITVALAKTLASWGHHRLSVGFTDFVSQGVVSVGQQRSDEEFPDMDLSSDRVTGAGSAIGVVQAATNDGCTIQWTITSGATITAFFLYMR